MTITLGAIVPGIPHPLLCPQHNEGWMRLNQGFAALREQILAAKPDVLLVYSTMWPSVIGHQVQARPNPEWVHVDELFHDLGSIPYRFRIDAELAGALNDAAHERGLQCRTIDHHGFPIDTGSVVALKLLTPNNEVPAVIVSSNVYADRAETVVFAKAARDALARQGKTAAAICVMTLSNRLFTDWIDPASDRIHSPKDQEWNDKVLQFVREGRLEDISQLSRVIHSQIRVKKVVNFKPMWWLSGLMGQHNRYDGTVFASAPLYGTGAAVASFVPSQSSVGDKEYDEDDVEVWGGDRTVLGEIEGDQGGQASVPASDAHRAPSSSHAVHTKRAPAPVGPYPHARRVGDLLYVSGMGPRQPGTDAIPGGPIRDADGNPLDYDVRAQTAAVFDNIQVVLEDAGSGLHDIVDITCFLVDMDRDFADFNDVYREYMADIGPTRTTVEVRALPTPIAVELKVVARPS